MNLDRAARRHDRGPDRLGQLPTPFFIGQARRDGSGERLGVDVAGAGHG